MEPVRCLYRRVFRRVPSAIVGDAQRAYHGEDEGMICSGHRMECLRPP